jgi:hypothetical protein
MLIRIQDFENLKKFTAGKIKYCNLLIPYRTSKLQEKSSSIKREHPALENFSLVGHSSILCLNL